jgi:DNA-binding NarL/FixJ family response regulator
VTNRLTPRETEVLQLLAEGLSRREVAVRLFVSPSTVKAHMQHVLPKLGARNTVHAAAIAVRRGLLAESEAA